MPKVIELTVEIDIQKVSCPGVWLCQDGYVSLTVFTLGTSYQTCLLPPMFPLVFKDIFYFRKRFQESCALNNICCLLRDETIYCELVQWSEDCTAGECVVLAQYLGALNDVLFSPNMCSSDGVDLLMRRSKDFPGILSPKIEITTKVRIDEVVNQSCWSSSLKVQPCHCSPRPEVEGRQKQVCHSTLYHRSKCVTNKRMPRSRSRSRSRSCGSRSKSCCSLRKEKEVPIRKSCCNCPNPIKSRISPYWRSPPTSQTRRYPNYNVYNVNMPGPEQVWRDVTGSTCDRSSDDVFRTNDEPDKDTQFSDEKPNKFILESRYIDQDKYNEDRHKHSSKKHYVTGVTPCVCDICRRYHELFHTNRKTVM